jgi:hypothetical protein
VDRKKNSVFNRGFEYLRKEGLISTIKFGLLWTPLFAYYRFIGDTNYNDEGIDLFSEDWDNIIILDACRYDIFEEIYEFPGRLEKKQSKASSTSEFIKANFSNKILDDIIYISGNTWFRRLKKEINSEVYELFDVTKDGGRNKVESTVECAKYCDENHPDKRLIIHFIPPHHPLKGPTAKDNLPSTEEQLNNPFYERIRKGKIEIEDDILKQAYIENLERILPEVEELLNSLQGKTVVTSDHGEMLGEDLEKIPYQFYGHAPGLHTDKLTEIPWYVHPHDSRKNICSDDIREKVNFKFSKNEKSAKDRLHDFGYDV